MDLIVFIWYKVAGLCLVALLLLMLVGLPIGLVAMFHPNVHPLDRLRHPSRNILRNSLELTTKYEAYRVAQGRLPWTKVDHYLARAFFVTRYLNIGDVCAHLAWVFAWSSGALISATVAVYAVYGSGPLHENPLRLIYATRMVATDWLTKPYSDVKQGRREALLASEKRRHETTQIPLPSELRQYKLLGVKSGKPGYADIQDVQTGSIYQSIRLGPSCYSPVDVGTVLNVITTSYHYASDKETIYYEFQDLQDIICD